MSDNSDGDKNKKGDKMPKAPNHSMKTRSLSVGSKMDLTNGQTEKIVSTHINTKYLSRPSADKEDKKALADKESKHRSPINVNEYVYSGNIKPISHDKINMENCDISKEVCETQNVDDPNKIFKPRNSFLRTPPKKENEVSEQSSGKRNRSVETPEIEIITKRPCDRTTPPVQPEHDQMKIHTIPKSEHKIDLEKIISEAFSSMDIISELIATYCNSNQEQNTLNKASINIHKSLTMLLYRIGVLEKDNLFLKFQLDNKSDTNKADETKEQPKLNSNREREIGELTKKSYADVSALTRDNIPQNSATSSNWTTPIHRKKIESKISIENINDTAKTMQQIKQNLSTKDIGGGFKNIKYLKSGAVIIESHTEEQLGKLKLALTSAKNVRITDTGNLDPMFMLTGLRKGLTNSELMEDIIKLNEEVMTELGASVTDKIKIVAKRSCRNQSKENWILQAPPDVAKWFLKKQKIYIDLMVVYIQEHINLAICFNCSGFGHVAKYCRERICCHKCGDEHQGKNCDSDVLKCPNCTRLKIKLEESQHSARDSQCPVYQRRLGQYQSNINYNSTQSVDFLPKMVK